MSGSSAAETEGSKLNLRCEIQGLWAKAHGSRAGLEYTLNHNIKASII